MTSRTPAALAATALQHLIATANAPRLIDVRTPGEFEAAHIPGSYNVPLDVLREHRDELRAHLDEEVVLVCRSGQRATAAEQALAAAGLSNLRILDGGISAWQAAGAPVHGGKRRWDLERQVRLVAGSIVLTAVLASVAVPPAKWAAAVIGAGLTFAALSNTCVMGMLLAKLPYNRGPRLDVDGVIAALAAPRA
ncbi:MULTISPECIES: rhodanese-like domain-containing protein [unclassified Pseudofrankia]|uniref:rhodanese-like domain-containing protein n=1 Tax=unclassified Pseudofrankia TaxID=2994372 RepID=UPI0008D9C744|nr:MULTISPECIES: rhodanese-like domain-containing protein [unclassified Pseudofrankia]MDT3439405.1 rhodanese-like domain-containing protein [Pseudofrankia sp. BMG5.37]OHV48803.1 sulfurtransferase [Pseudofrankia sp. BMG5.36]